MELLQQETKRIVTHNPLPATCGPQCKLYDLSSHRCIVSLETRKANSNCTLGYTTAEVDSLANQTNVIKLLSIALHDGTNLP